MKSGAWVRELMRELKRSGVEFELVEKAKHHQLYIGGELVVCMSKGSTIKASTMKNCESHIKRAVRRALDVGPVLASAEEGVSLSDVYEGMKRCD